jgi:signal transduction histidine kinase
MSVNNLTHRMDRLTQIGRELSSASDLDRVLQSILSAAAELTGSEAASVLALDEESNTLHFLAVPPAHQSMLQSVSVPLDKSIAGIVFSQKKTAAVNNVSKSPFHYKAADQVSGFKTRSLLAAPIMFRNESLGVIEVLNKTDGSDYNGDDVIILETLASQTAIAVQNTRLQKLLEKTQGDANRLDKMKSDFVAITSHELRTPLGLIIGHSTFLRELVSEDEYVEQLDAIIKSAMRLKEIIENMSSMDNFQSGMAVVRQRSVSVRRLILDTIVSYRQDAEVKKVSIDLDLADSDLLIEGDGEKIGIAITNLVKNAVTYTKEGGHVFIVSEQVPGYVKVSVIDDGIGIPLKDLPHIFDRFYQVESHLTRKHGGMGLGLSVAKMMVEMHGGRIWAESSEGKGSIFTMLLPLDSSQAQAAQRVFR